MGEGEMMNANLFKSLLGILVMGIAGYAHAAVFTLTDNNPPGPTLNPGDIANFSNSGPNGTTFNDNWFFQLGQPGAGGLITNVDITVGTTSILNISPFTVNLYAESGGVPFGASLASGTSFNLPSLASGMYDLVITGTATGILGGQYIGTVAASAVPLPAAAWLLLSGLAGVAAMARRRRTG
jgi:hypothetical protein